MKSWTIHLGHVFIPITYDKPVSVKEKVLDYVLTNIMPRHTLDEVLFRHSVSTEA